MTGHDGLDDPMPAQGKRHYRWTPDPGEGGTCPGSYRLLLWLDCQTCDGIGKSAIEVSKGAWEEDASRVQGDGGNWECYSCG